MSSSLSSPLWVKLRFFTRIRRFIRAKAGKRSPPSDDDHHLKEEPETRINGGDGDDVAGKLQRAVKMVHFGGYEDKEAAASDIAVLAGNDVTTRKVMGGLGVVPPLVAMAASDEPRRRRKAISALLQLAHGTYTNKALMVEAGILSKLPKDTSLLDEATKLGFSELILTLSTLANTSTPLSPLSEIIPFAVQILESETSSKEAKEACLGSVHNLSTMLENAVVLVSNNAVETLLKLVTNSYSATTNTSEKALATLGNLVVTSSGKKAVENSPSVPASLIKALAAREGNNKSKCQEMSAYILMVLAHQSSAQRARMAQLGIVAVLLEVALLGSPLAQKRALKLLQWFKDERQARVGPHSGPQVAAVAMGSPRVSSHSHHRRQGKRMMESLVRQSLHRNMEMITSRANNSASSPSPSHHDRLSNKAFVISTSSKSLPY